jgi:hypothetical protein
MMAETARFSRSAIKHELIVAEDLSATTGHSVICFAARADKPTRLSLHFVEQPVDSSDDIGIDWPSENGVDVILCRKIKMVCTQ